MQSNKINIEPKPVEKIPASTLQEEAKKTLEKISDDKIDAYRANAEKAKTKFSASDWLNVIKGLAQQQALQAMGFEPNASFSFKTFGFVLLVILIIAAIFIIKS